MYGSSETHPLTHADRGDGHGPTTSSWGCRGRVMVGVLAVVVHVVAGTAGARPTGLYFTYGEFEATVKPYDMPGNTVEGDAGNEVRCEVSDSGEAFGTAGHYAYAAYSASLTDGTLGVAGYARNGIIPGDLFGGGASGKAAADFKDTLTFTIPAGSYPAGVWVETPIALTGWMQAAGDPRFQEHVKAHVQWSFYWRDGNGVGDGIHLNNETDPSDQLVNTRLVLSECLLSPGTVLDEPKAVTRQLLASILCVAGAYREVVPGEAETDFGSTARILAVNVPPEVTWTSASGHFVPEPAALGLLALGALAIRRRSGAPS
ncbi:MAG: hypothetical protein ACOC95_00290 [Planctomycetota bacterium]